MHMSDALITPVVGGTMLATSSGAMGYSIKKLKIDIFEKRLPLMAVMGAFLFASQMINFAIPGTGSSGHIGGGILLAIVLGPSAGFLTMACVLLIQALFFADGGLLAFGCNLMNLGFFTCFVAYPLIFKPMIAGKMRNNSLTKKRIITASLIASIVGLQLGSLGVVAETFLSGRTELNIGTFLLFMQPIHLAIGIVEGVITGVIVNYLYSQNTEMIYTEDMESVSGRNYKKSIVTIVVITFIVGGIVSLAASGNPDGLEWAIFKTANAEEVVNDSGLIAQIESIQEQVALLPDYGFESENSSESVGTSVSGIIGSLITLLITFALGTLIKRRRRKKNSYE